MNDTINMQLAVYICNMIQKLKENWQLFLIMSLMLGLAPFNPPHIWGKLQWIAGGGAFAGEHPMELIDWADFLMHGSPWILLMASAIMNGLDFLKSKK